MDDNNAICTEQDCNDENEINDFYDTFILLKNSADNNWNYNNVLDFIIDANATTASKEELGKMSYKEVQSFLINDK